MTLSHSLLSIFTQLVSDLTREMPESERYRRLLMVVREIFPCDATALLRLEGDTLVPLAAHGLSHDTLGRRFRLQDHPRFLFLLEKGSSTRFIADCPHATRLTLNGQHGSTRFAANCSLPDPYDGLVEDCGRNQAMHACKFHDCEVHDCIGCPIYVDNRPWGVLTLDAFGPKSFDAIDLSVLEAFSSLAAATVLAAERMSGLVRHAEHGQQLAEAFKEAAGHTRSRELIGQSQAMQHLREEIDLVAATDLVVLISGETGVGKELVAQAIHARSVRAGRPLITLNCAALPDNLVESELFGHVRGAFTGAVNERRGKFELADGGTLFLDEVGELPLSMQAKLLRALQSGQLQRLGSDHERHVNVRIIAATNRDLSAEVRAGRFRADLYHRISVYPLRVPPLRERGRDVLLLAGTFLEENRVRLGLRGMRLAADAQEALLSQPWPGNVRELEHLISRGALKAAAENTERARILSLRAHHLEAAPSLAPAATEGLAENVEEPPASLRQAVEDLQRRLIRQTLSRQAGNWAAAARDLGLDRANLHRLSQRLGLK